MIRVIAMIACFVLAGLNGWLLIPPHHGGAFNAVGFTTALGAGVYTLASLVKYP
jgi:hypothetical protein